MGAVYREVSALTGEGLEELVEGAGRLSAERAMSPKAEAESPVDEQRERAKLKKRRLFRG
jgi:hypothetical protein